MMLPVLNEKPQGYIITPVVMKYYFNKIIFLTPLNFPACNS